MVDEIAKYQEEFETLFTLALGPEESIEYIERVARTM